MNSIRDPEYGAIIGATEEYERILNASDNASSKKSCKECKHLDGCRIAKFVFWCEKFERRDK